MHADSLPTFTGLLVLGLDTRPFSSHTGGMERKPRKEAKPAVRKTATARKTPAATTTTTKRTRVARKVRQPEAPTPLAPRRAVFIDVENTSSESDLLRVLDHLKIDRAAQPTEVIAVGNWRAVGAKIARMLAGLGAQLVHSAPAIGVRDWSDLWIAVAAGRWLATARPGDTLEIVSDDRAFDAVSDAAASIGVVCRRTSYRHLPGGERAATAEPARRRRRRGRHAPDASRHAAHPSSSISGAPPPGGNATPSHGSADEEAHTAPQEQIRAALVRLSSGDSSRWISLDALANTLRAEGFTRPPGSPRLVVRLRRMKNVEVSPTGQVRLLDHDATHETAVEPEAVVSEPAPRRPRRRGGRRRRRRPAQNDQSAPATTTDVVEPPR